MKELKARSALKSFLWRLIGVLVLGIVTFFYTGSWVQTSLITVIHHFLFLFIYFAHERLWNKIGNRVTGNKRYILKMFLYEIILGQGILGIISLIITGSWQQASLISVTYILNKLWIYIIYDKLWDKIKWGKK